MASATNKINRRSIVNQAEELRILAARLTALEDVTQIMLEQMAEQNLRVRFILDHFKFTKPGNLIDPATGQPVRDVYDLFAIYKMGRAEFAARLEKEMEQVHANASRQGASSNGNGERIEAAGAAVGAEQDRALAQTFGRPNSGTPAIPFTRRTNGRTN